MQLLPGVCKQALISYIFLQIGPVYWKDFIFGRDVTFLGFPIRLPLKPANKLSKVSSEGRASCLSTHRVLPGELASRLFTLLQWFSVDLLLQKESRVDGLFMHSTSVTGQIHSKFSCMIWIWMLDKRKASDTRTPPTDWPVPHASPRPCRTAMSCWCALIREKQLAMVDTARVIWLCACLRYWWGHGFSWVGVLM